MYIHNMLHRCMYMYMLHMYMYIQCICTYIICYTCVYTCTCYTCTCIYNIRAQNVPRVHMYMLFSVSPRINIKGGGAPCHYPLGETLVLCINVTFSLRTAFTAKFEK